MQNFTNTIIQLFKYVLLPLALIWLLIKFFSTSRGKGMSADPIVNNTIDVIDNSIDKFGYFNRDHEPIFSVLEKLNSDQILKLHKDFGTRLHNPVTGQYKFFDTFGWRGYTVERNLVSIFTYEFDTEQLQRITALYMSKGVSFPLVKKII
ncbi:hypothetical protein [Tenacibaculum amylolyticum]|uniref:hypothetical protein n=1 Tax=Tenacibaculum amylolyticum TaxID=104269 RepID=UPI0038932B4E